MALPRNRKSKRSGKNWPKILGHHLEIIWKIIGIHWKIMGKSSGNHETMIKSWDIDGRIMSSDWLKCRKSLSNSRIQQSTAKGAPNDNEGFSDG